METVAAAAAVDDAADRVAELSVYGRQTTTTTERVYRFVVVARHFACASVSSVVGDTLFDLLLVEILAPAFSFSSWSKGKSTLLIL